MMAPHSVQQEPLQATARFYLIPGIVAVARSLAQHERQQ
jgi:hypothetical protein